MVRILLVIDDYNELIYLQTLLKKIGFDIEGLNSSKKYADSSLGFNPKVVIGSAFGKKVDILTFGKDIRKSRGFPKLLALKPTGRDVPQSQMDAAGIDLSVDSPVNIKKLILGISNLVGIDEAGFLDKLSKIAVKEDSEFSSDLMMLGSLDNLDGDLTENLAKKEISQMLGLSDEAPHDEIAEEPEVEPVSETSSYQPTPEDVQSRRARFDKFLASMEKPKSGRFSRDRIIEFNKKIRSAQRPDDSDEVEDQKKSFVKALFNKKT